MSLTISQVRDDLLSKLGIEDAALASALALQDVVVAINGAMQMLQTAGEDYFTRQHLTVALAAGTASYTLAGAVQAVLGPIRMSASGAPLRALASRGELDQYDRIVLGSTTYGAAAGTPRAYWVENLRAGTTGDINQINLFFCPTPNATLNVDVEVVDDAPSYSVSDLSGSTVLPIAQNYTESILLPIARMLVTRSSQFSRADILAQLTTDGQAAMQRLGLAGGFPNATQPQPRREIKA